jgi:REP element-mobilizing transposase RayT
MPFYQLFYHLVWSTKHRQPLLTEQVEPIVHNLLRTKAIGLGGTVFAVNGMADHVHMVVSIPPAIAVAKFVGQIKATASTRFNKGGHGAPIYWQEEYGAFSFDGKRLPNFIAYVDRQKEHHKQGGVFAILERVEGETPSPLLMREDVAVYAAEDEDWRREMLALSPPGDESPG